MIFLVVVVVVVVVATKLHRLLRGVPKCWLGIYEISILTKFKFYIALKGKIKYCNYLENGLPYTIRD